MVSDRLRHSDSRTRRNFNPIFEFRLELSEQSAMFECQTWASAFGGKVGASRRTWGKGRHVLGRVFGLATRGNPDITDRTFFRHIEKFVENIVSTWKVVTTVFPVFNKIGKTHC
ncbi:hypothetical protein TcasGA2_TC034334 [Tribolium castaneum]|uniref:Uncharacterized protein n=1 Tax=Tribolium castaneum TaxID=7070 RepID=A0A139WCC0_TRICA|nr:hypothetical protein TcasGA2_TC034334 [Tribolium castaneum]